MQDRLPPVSIPQMGCIAEDDLLDLVQARRPLGDEPTWEEHLASCPACSSLLCTLVDAARDDRPDRSGTMLGPYRLDGLIGAGAMGEVYRGWDERLKRRVAVKVLSRQLAESRELVRRLEAEGRAAAAITHGNVVTVYDTGSDDGVPFVVSELIDGELLRSMIDRGAIPRPTAIDLARQLARGVAAAHAQGVVHRDLKPGNLIVTGDGTLKILDFGLAKLVAERDVEATEPGTLMGTSGYLSPEQARGEPADARSDIFAIGAIIYELVTGTRAFGGATFAERLSAVLRDEPPATSDPLAPIIARCLDKDPRKRFQSAADLAWALDAPAPAPPAPRPRTPISRRAFLAGAAATGIGGFVLGRVLAPSRRPAVQREYHQMTFRQGRVTSARFTHDGGTMLYSAAWEELPSAVYSTHLTGGGVRALELPAAQLLAASSRGELALSLDHAFVDGFYQCGQLALAPLEGGTPHRLDVVVQDADFTPDGSELAIVRRYRGRFRLELPLGRVLLEGGWIAHPRVSPDGTLVACTLHDSIEDDRGDLVVVTRDGTPRTVAANWSSIDAVAWAPDGNALWVSASRRGGNNAVRTIALDGHELDVLPSAGRLRIHDVAPDGSLAVAQMSGRMHMMAKPPGGAAELDLSLSDVTVAGDLSSDGNQLLFSEIGDVDDAANGAYIRSTAGGPALRLGAAIPIDLADDGRGVLALLYPPIRLAVLPVPSGQPKVIAIPQLASIAGARWASDGRMVVAGAAAGRPPRLWRFDPGGAITPLTDEGLAGDGAISPDGRRIAMLAGDRLLAIDIGAVATHEVPGAFADDAVCGWYDDLSIMVRSLTAPPIRVRKIDAATGASTDLFDIRPPGLGLRGVHDIIVSRHGDAYAYSYGHEQSRLYVVTST